MSDNFLHRVLLQNIQIAIVIAIATSPWPTALRSARNLLNLWAINGVYTHWNRSNFPILRRFTAYIKIRMAVGSFFRFLGDYPNVEILELHFVFDFLRKEQAYYNRLPDCCRYIFGIWELLGRPYLNGQILTRKLSIWILSYDSNIYRDLRPALMSSRISSGCFSKGWSTFANWNKETGL